MVVDLVGCQGIANLSQSGKQRNILREGQPFQFRQPLHYFGNRHFTIPIRGDLLLCR